MSGGVNQQPRGKSETITVLLCVLVFFSLVVVLWAMRSNTRFLRLTPPAQWSESKTLIAITAESIYIPRMYIMGVGRKYSE